ncbi:MAG: NADH-quinone oxidoreductase subunit N [Planctomycetaceae bacterium]
MSIDQIQQAAGLVVPEMILLGTMCVMFLAGPFLVSEAGTAAQGVRHRWGALSLAALAAAWFAWRRSTVQDDVTGPFRADELVWFVRGLTLVVGAVLALLVWNQIDDGHAAEAHACLLAILAGVNLTAAANDLVTLFLALELVSIPTYVLLYLPRRDIAMREATLKYFLLSIFSSALLLYGMSWLFGAAGTTSLAGIARQALAGKLSLDAGPVQMAVALMVAGLAFRITAVPFHFYAPDVFQGVTSSAAAMLSVVPKIVGFVALLRILPAVAGVASLDAWMPSHNVQQLLALMAVLTMFGGNLLALRQRQLHRLLAYSSVAHAGYMLVGLAVGGQRTAVAGPSALLFYLSAYGLMTIGVFAFFAAAGTRGKSLTTTAELAGLSRRRPVAALCLAVCLFSLTGLPPTAGFLGKLNLFLAAWSSESPLGQPLAAVLALNAAIAAWYYLRLIGVMYFEPSESPAAPAEEPAAWLAGTVCALATIALFAAPQWVWDAALRASVAM